MIKRIMILIICLWISKAGFIFAEDIGVIFISGEKKKENDYVKTDTFTENMPMQKQITIKEALDVPGVQGDPVKAIKTFAGVVSTSDMTGEMMIHGSKSAENSFSINHLPIPYLFHFGGLHSVIAPEATKQIDVYLGGFDTSYGHTMGGVIDISPKYPKGTNKGFVHTGIYDSSLGVDFKISDRINGFFGGRRSYFDLFVSKTGTLSSDSKVTYTKFPRFYDTNLIISVDSENSLYSFESITGQDSLIIQFNKNEVKDPKATGGLDHTSKFSSSGLRWRYKPRSNYEAHTLIYTGAFSNDTKIFDEYKADIKSYYNGLYHISTWKLEENKISSGVEFMNEKIPLDLYISKMPEKENPGFDFTTAEKIEYKKTFDVNNYAYFIQNLQTLTKKTKIRYGLRFFDSDYEKYDLRVNPRTSLIYSVSDDISTSISVGQYSQYTEPIKNVEKFGNKDLTYEDSMHYNFNYTQTFKNKNKISIEPYYKTFENLAVSVSDERNYVGTGVGNAYGLDFNFNKPALNSRWDFILNYTYLKANRTIKDGEIMKKFYGEIPHTIQFISSCKLKKDWKFGSLIKYHSGEYYTPVVDRYYEAAYARWRPTYGEYMSAQMPDYFSLNLKLSKTKYLSNDRSLEFSFEIMNATNHQNISRIEYNDEYTEKQYVRDLPLLPWFDITYRF